MRIKMCIGVNDEDFVVIHHELGHNYYQRAYRGQDPLFRDSANDGFHEGLGDTVALSITPEYLVRVGLLDRAPDADSDIGLLLLRALDKVAFLPFGLLVDQWRWQVFSGEIAPDAYNTTWWELRERYQGVRPALPRSEDDFDPGAKFHVPANTPYTRYFLAQILQFQFHRALCEVAGVDGPLHRCSIFESAAAGPAAARDDGAGRQPALARRARGPGRHAGDGRHRHPRLLRSARGLAGGAERRPDLRPGEPPAGPRQVAPRYSASLTFASQTVAASMLSATCVIGASGDAPCQCFSPGPMHATPPAATSCTGSPSFCSRQRPATTSSTWGPLWTCQAVRAPGWNVTRYALTVGDSHTASMRAMAASPVKLAGSAGRAGCAAGWNSLMAGPRAAGARRSAR